MENPYLSMHKRGTGFDDMKNVYLATIHTILDNDYGSLEEKIKKLEENREQWREYCKLTQ